MGERSIEVNSKEISVPDELWSLLAEDGLDEDGCIHLTDSTGKVYRRLKNPAVAYDESDFVILKYGEYSEVRDYVDNTIKVLRSSRASMCNDLAECIKVLEIHKNQQLLCKLFNNVGYLKIYIEACKQLKSIGGKQNDI